MICSAQHRGVACYCAELRLCSAALQHLEFAGRGQRGVYSHVPFFLGRWCEGKHGCVGGGALTEIKREFLHSATTHLRRHVESKVHVECSGSCFLVYTQSDTIFTSLFPTGVFLDHFKNFSHIVEVVSQPLDTVP